MDRKILVWTLEGIITDTIAGHSNAVVALAFSPNGRYLLSGSFDSTARLWTWPEKQGKIFRGHTDYVSTVAFAPDNQSFLTGSWDGAIVLHHVDKEQTKVLVTNPEAIFCAAFSPDGQRVLTSAWDSTIRVWSLPGKLLQTFRGHRDAVTAAVFSPDQRYILSVGRDQTARLWMVDQQVTNLPSETIDLPGDAVEAEFSTDGDTIFVCTRTAIITVLNHLKLAETGIAALTIQQQIAHDLARRFARAFYEKLAQRLSIADAFTLACGMIEQQPGQGAVNNKIVFRAAGFQEDNANLQILNDEIRRELPEPTLPGEAKNEWDILISTREDVGEGQLRVFAEYRLDKLSSAAARALFLRYHTLRAPDAENDLDKLLDFIDYHTLTVEVFAKSLAASRGGRDIQAILHRFEGSTVCFTL